MVRLIAFLLGLTGLAAGGGGFYYSVHLPEQAAPHVAEAAELVAEARVALVRFSGDAERVANLVPAVQRAVAELSASSEGMGRSLTELGEGSTAIASAMRRLGNDLETVGARLGPLIGSGTNLSASAGELRTAAGRLESAAAIIPSLSEGIQRGASAVGGLAESLGTVPLAEITAGVEDVDSQLASLEVALRSDDLLASARWVAFGLSGFLAFQGLCMLVIAAAMGRLKRVGTA